MIPNPWVLLGIVLAWLASLGAVGFWQNDAGRTAERVVWQAKENAELKAAKAEIERLNKDARATEARHATELAIVGADYEKQSEDAEAQRRHDVAAARDGALRLRVAGACHGAPASGTGATSAAAPGGDAATTAELPGTVTADLLALADDADQVVRQLTACQGVIRSYIDQKGPSP